MAGRAITIVAAPSGLGLVATGVAEAPETLLRLGLATRAGASEVVTVPAPVRGGASNPDPDSGIRNADALARYSHDLAEAVRAVLGRGGWPLVLGGDCSILLGCLLAARRRGRTGLLFLDGHADFYQPAADPLGEAASMELALATGRGPAVLAHLEGLGALVADEDVVALGRRDAEEAEQHGSQRIEDTAIEVVDLTRLRELGPASVARRSLDALEAACEAGYWVHLDVDVLDEAVMPAVDYRLPGGFSWDELDAILHEALRPERAAAGLDVTIYNPRLDAGGEVGRVLVEHLGRALGG